MKLKKFNQINEREGFDDIDEPFDYDEYEEGDPDEDVELQDVSGDELESLASALRKFIKEKFDNSYAYVDSDGTISLEFILNKSEKIGNIMKAMNAVRDVQYEYLAEYESEFELWETRGKDPLIVVNFYYNPNAKSKSEPPKPF